MNKLEINIPDFLNEDIDEYIKALETGKFVDCEYESLRAAINNAEVRGFINSETANRLRRYYL